MVGAAGFEPATAGLEIRCSIRLSYAPSLVFSSVYQLRPLRKLYKGCTCLKGFGQLAHRILNFYVAHLDVALLGRAYNTVTQYPLNHQIIDAQFLEIGRKSPPIGVPARAISIQTLAKLVGRRFRAIPGNDCEPIKLEFDNDLYIQEWTKTQFAGAEIHLTVCDFLHAIEPYFETLKVNDEAEYWDTGDIKLLKQHLANCDRFIEEHLQEHPPAKVKVKEPTGRIVDMPTYD